MVLRDTGTGSCSLECIDARPQGRFGRRSSTASTHCHLQRGRIEGRCLKFICVHNQVNVQLCYCKEVLGPAMAGPAAFCSETPQVRQYKASAECRITEHLLHLKSICAHMSMETRTVWEIQSGFGSRFCKSAMVVCTSTPLHVALPALSSCLLLELFVHRRKPPSHIELQIVICAGHGPDSV